MTLLRHKITVLLAACIFCVSASARADSKSLTERDSLWTPQTEFFGSLQAVVDTQNPWVVEFGDSLFVKVIPPPKKYFDELHRSVALYEFCVRNGNGVTTKLSTTKVMDAPSLSGFTIVRDVDNCLFYSTQSEPLFTDLAISDFNIKPGDKVTLRADQGAKIIKFDSLFEPYNDTGHLNRNEQSFARSCTGKWVFLDQVTPNDRSVAVGRQYVIDIVDDPDNKGGYLLLYGANDDSSKIWKAGDIKGRLSPSGFMDNYDLIWYDSHKRQVGHNENSATVEGYNLLRLDFPLLRSQLRFKRVED